MDFYFSSNGIEWRMVLAEIDPRNIESFKVNVTLELEHPSGKFGFSADDIWFEAEGWDQFETALRNWPSSGEGAITFSDMSQYFQISLRKSATDMNASITVYEPLADGLDARLSFGNRIELDSSFLARLTGCFAEWPKHW